MKHIYKIKALVNRFTASSEEYTIIPIPGYEIGYYVVRKRAKKEEKPLGIIMAVKIAGYYQLTWFGIHESIRGKGYGKLLMDKAKETVMKRAEETGIKRIVVYPNPDSAWEPTLSIKETYAYYERQGFQMENPDADRTIPNHTMYWEWEK